MQLEGILHTPLSSDAYAVSEEELVVRVRTAKKDIEECTLCYGDRVCMKDPIDITEIEMEKVGTDQLYDYFEGRIQSDYTRICYYFKMKDLDKKENYYSEYGFSKEMTCPRTQYFQFPYIRREDMIQNPDWAKSMVMYHIFPDSFASRKEKIDQKEKEIILDSGLKSVSSLGGTLKGVRENLDYIQELGANCIYLNPIFEAASYHKYDTIDYLKVDPCFGTKEELKELVEECHRRSMYVILDGVFNHCGSGFFAFQDVLEKGEDSEYVDWFYKLTFPIRYETPPNYEAFAYVKEMPKLNTGNKKVRDYFCEVGKYWIREVGIDGWRLDVANEVDHEFWRAFRRAVHEEKEDVFLIGEIWEDSAAWLQGDQFDSTMNYTFSYICKEFFAEESITLKEFDEKINHMNLRYQENISLAQMNFLDTHDVPRFLSYCGSDQTKLKMAVFYMMTAMGIPSVFYGDEMGIEGVQEREYRAPMPWEKKCTDLFAYYKSLIQIRRNEKALWDGSYRTKFVDEEKKLYGFVRSNKKDKILVVFNYGNEPQQIKDKMLEKEWMELITQKAGVGKDICPAKEGRIYKLSL